jgi:hypothetical protein
MAIGAEHGQIVDYIDAQNLRLTRLSRRISDFDAVSIGRVNQLRYDVVIGDDMAARVSEKSRSN